MAQDPKTDLEKKILEKCSIKRKINENEKVSISQKILYSLGGLGSGLLMGIFNAGIIKFYNDIIRLDPARISLAFTIYAIWNAINDPIFGYLSDRFRWKGKEYLGARLPWIRMANPFLALFFALVWYCPIGNTWLQFWYLFFILIGYDAFYTIIGLNYGALLAEMSESTQERSRIQLVAGVFGLVAAIVSIIIPGLLLTQNTNIGKIKTTMLIISFIGLGFSELCAYGVKIKALEPPEEQYSLWMSIKTTFHNKSFMALVISNFTMVFLITVVINGLFYYTEYVLHLTGIQIIYPVIFVVMGIGLGAKMLMYWIEKEGLREAMLKGLIVTGVGFIIITFLQGLAAYVAMGIIGFGIVMPALTFNVFIGDLADEDELISGERREGIFLGVNALITKPAQSLAASFIVYMLAWFSYKTPIEIDGIYHAQVQSDFTLWGIRIMFGLIPGICVLIGAWIFSYYDLSGEKLLKIKEDVKKLHKKKLIIKK